MTVHYQKTLKELTAKDIWDGARWNRGYNIMIDFQPNSFIPPGYGIFCEADHYALDAWTYLEHLRKGGGKTILEWLSNWVPKDEEDRDKKEMYEKLLTEVVDIYKAELKGNEIKS